MVDETTGRNQAIDEMIRRNRAVNQEMFGPSGEHDHHWGMVERAFFTGNPHRKCRVEGCRHITRSHARVVRTDEHQ